jgi:predicted amidophosphoribosyltransferase
LLLDDLYRSGATLNEVTQTIKAAINGIRVIALALTKTRTRR